MNRLVTNASSIDDRVLCLSSMKNLVKQYFVELKNSPKISAVFIKPDNLMTNLINFGAG